jgi:hypothetical protein
MRRNCLPSAGKPERVKKERPVIKYGMFTAKEPEDDEDRSTTKTSLGWSPTDPSARVAEINCQALSSPWIVRAHSAFRC